MKKLAIWLILLVLLLVPSALAAEKDGLKYSGDRYYAIVRKGVWMRDKDFKEMKYLKAGTPVRVWGNWEADVSPSRVVIDDQEGDFGTVIKGGLKKVSSPPSNTVTSAANSSKSYWAVARYKLNLRDNNGKLICEVPRAARIEVIRTNSKDKSRVDIIYGSHKGSVILEGTKKVKDAIFVDIAAQKVTLIKGGKLIATSKCVTGTKGTKDTPKGMFKIIQKHMNKVFASGRESDFWLRWCGGCGFHDATWRDNWSSNAYKKSGSNGCVNLPYKFAKTLYNNSYVGMSVYVS